MAGRVLVGLGVSAAMQGANQPEVKHLITVKL